MSAPHLSDDRLIELALGRFGSVRDDGHLAACAMCQSRHASLAVMLDEVGEASVTEADLAFPASRLARQRTRILQRVAQISVPGRVLAFPGMPASVSSVFVGLKPNTRWVAAAALAGLLVGLLADHALTRLPSAPRRVAREVAQSTSTDLPASIRPVASAQSEDEFFGQLEAAVGSAGPLVLHPLDAMTPRAWDVVQ